jgi:glycosyltransferase involved in cell wall biosynthesis
VISVIIPAYQAEQYISDSIQSAFTQTLPPAEVIVVDDGSTDSTAGLAKALGAKVISQSNTGVAHARNVGIKAAQHEWIALLDADDVWENNKLESQWAALNSFPEVGFVTCNNSFFLNDQTYQETYLDKLGSDYFRAGGKEVERGIMFFERVDFRGVNWIVPSPSALLIRKSVFSSIGYLDEQLNGVDDMEFYLRAMGHFPFLFLEAPLVKYRQTIGGQGKNQLLCGASFLMAIEKITANPDSYPPGVSETVTKARANRMAIYGKALLRAGKFREARQVLRQSWRQELKPTTFSWWLASLARVKI